MKFVIVENVFRRIEEHFISSGFPSIFNAICCSFVSREQFFLFFFFKLSRENFNNITFWMWIMWWISHTKTGKRATLDQCIRHTLDQYITLKYCKRIDFFLLCVTFYCLHGYTFVWNSQRTAAKYDKFFHWKFTHFRE